MTDTKQPEALRLAEILEGDYCPDWFYEQGVDEVTAELRRQHARIAELEAQLEAIGAGGVSGPLMGQPQAMPDISALTERGAQAWAGVDAQGLRDNFTAADMATAEARGFRDGVASVAANAGSEPVAQPSDADAILSKIFDLFLIGKLARTESTILTNIRNVIRHARMLHAVERDLFPQPELPDDDDPYAEVDEGLPTPNSWAAKDEADYVAQFREALAARGLTHPSPPEGMVGGWTKASQQLPPCRDDQLYVGINTAGFAGVFNAVADIAGYVHCMYETPEETIDVMSSLDIWQPFTPPTTSAGSGEGIDMSCNLFPRFYDQLVDEDIEWLKTNAPDCLERKHILAVLEFSKREYRLRGYDEAMSKTGPHYQKDPS